MSPLQERAASNPGRAALPELKTHTSAVPSPLRVTRPHGLPYLPAWPQQSLGPQKKLLSPTHGASYPALYTSEAWEGPSVTGGRSLWGFAAVVLRGPPKPAHRGLLCPPVGTRPSSPSMCPLMPIMPFYAQTAASGSCGLSPGTGCSMTHTYLRSTLGHA